MLVKNILFLCVQKRKKYQMGIFFIKEKYLKKYFVGWFLLK